MLVCVSVDIIKDIFEVEFGCIFVYLGLEELLVLGGLLGGFSLCNNWFFFGSVCS